MGVDGQAILSDPSVLGAIMEQQPIAPYIQFDMSLRNDDTVAFQRKGNIACACRCDDSGKRERFSGLHVQGEY